MSEHKPWEETWSYTMQYDQDMGPALFANGQSILSAHEWEREPEEARIKLIAQAPAMARLLLVLDSWLSNGRKTPHYNQLDIQKVLRAAGVLPTVWPVGSCGGTKCGLSSCVDCQGAP